jgi:hypothetical protein
MLSETKCQVINLRNCRIWLVNLFELYDDAQTYQRQIQNLQFFRLLFVDLPCLPAKFVDDEAGELCNQQQRQRVQNLKLRRKYGAYI